MDRSKAQEQLKIFGNPVITKDGEIVAHFTRQTIDNITTIEQMSDMELIDDWKGLVQINHVFRQVSLNDLQRMDLIELEFDARDSIDSNELRKWFDEQINTREEVAKAFYNHPDDLDQSKRNGSNNV